MSDTKYYRINGDPLDAIAKQVQKMVGITEKMTPAEMLYWLGRITYIPQGWARSTMIMPVFATGATARLPVVVKTTANSESSMSSLDFESTAVGFTQEV